MEKPTIYVLQEIHYDYYEFQRLILASVKLSEIHEYLIQNNSDVYNYLEVYNWWELSDEDKIKIHEIETKHYRITKF